MKKKFINNLKQKKILPLSLYFLEGKEVDMSSYLLKYEKSRNINSEGYELLSFYKVISKF